MRHRWAKHVNLKYWALPIATSWGYVATVLLRDPHRRVLPPGALLDSARLSASVEPVETILHGPLRDQAALHGARI